MQRNPATLQPCNPNASCTPILPTSLVSILTLLSTLTFPHLPSPSLSLPCPASPCQAPIARVCGADTPFPLAMEKIYLPDELKVYDAIKKSMEF